MPRGKRASVFSAMAALVTLAAMVTIGVRALVPPSPSAAELRGRFEALLRHPEKRWPPVVSPGSDFFVERGEFYSEARQRVPFLVVKSAKAEGRLAAVIVLHGTGSNKDDVQAKCLELAKRGLLAIAIDARYHGDRISGGAHGSEEYQDAIIRAWRETNHNKQEHPLYYDTVYDIWRTLDYLESRRDVDARRIGMIGYSMGGIVTWLAAATDERIRVVVPAIAVQSFRWSLENNRWQGRASVIQRVHEAAARDLGEPEVNARVCRMVWNKVIPGILDDFDCPNMVRAIAPRPLLILSAEKDPFCPLESAQVAFVAAREAYQKARAEDRLRINVGNGVGHLLTEEQERVAYDWLERWLRH